jgi:hypothetical protein
MVPLPELQGCCTGTEKPRFSIDALFSYSSRTGTLGYSTAPVPGGRVQIQPMRSSVLFLSAGAALDGSLQTQQGRPRRDGLAEKLTSAKRRGPPSQRMSQQWLRTAWQP